MRSVDLVRDVEAAAEAFLAMHRPGRPLLLPNPWDVGSARVLASLGFEALATTSSGSAAASGCLDGSLTRDEAVARAAEVAAAVPLPVSADLENGFAHEPEGVAETVRAAAGAGLAGCSIEDSTHGGDVPVYDVESAVERVAAAVQAAHAGPRRLVLTARAENHLYGRDDLTDTITRLQRYAEAGADVLYAPGLASAADIRRLVSEVDRPVNVLSLPAGPSVAELADLGVARISIGGSLTSAALGALVDAAREWQTGGTAFWRHAAAGRAAVRAAFPEDGRPLATRTPLTLDEVAELAAAAHAGQEDKLGVPYVEHVRAVASGLRPFGPRLEMAGWLHDVVEDTPWTAERLLAAGVPAGVVATVTFVSKPEPPKPGVSYMDRIRAITKDRDATLVKIADNAHNTRPDRVAALNGEDQARLGERYEEARKLLWAAVSATDVRRIVERVNPALAEKTP